MDKSSRPVTYVRSDATLLVAVMIGGLPDGRPVTLADLLMDADALNASIRTFDEVSFGLPRLVAGGFVDIGRTKRGGAAGDRDTR